MTVVFQEWGVTAEAVGRLTFLHVVPIVRETSKKIPERISVSISSLDF